MYKNKGITLVALVITIILLLILAGISIQAITHTGIFDSAKQAELENKRGQVTEYLNLKLLNQQMLNSLGTAEEIITATRATIKQTELEQIGKKVEIGEISREEDFKQVEIYFYVTVDDDLYKVELKGVNFIGNKKEIAPAIRIKKLSNTTSSITVEVETQNNTGGIIEYYIKKEDGEYNCIETTTEKSYTYKNLEQGKKYSVKIVAVAKNEKTAEVVGEQITGKVTDLTEADTTFSYDPSEGTWTNGSVTVTVSTTVTGYTLQTSKDGQSWSDETSQTFTENGTVYARLCDGTNGGKALAANVTNIDTTEPSSFTIANSAVGPNSFTLSATFEDNESGLGKIVWYYKRPQDSSWQSEEKVYTELNGSTKGTTESTTKTYSISDMTIGGEVQAYAIGYDVAGNSITTTNATSSNPLAFDTETYTISYDANGGSGAPSSQSKYYGINITLSSTTPTRSEFDFLGWSTSDTATSATYEIGAQYNSNSSITLYAVWQLHDFTVIGNKRSDATCTEAATYWYNCSKCGLQGDTYFYSGEALGHTGDEIGSTIVEPTCIEKGSRYKKCTRCGENYGSVELSALGHLNLTSSGHCDRCGTAAGLYNGQTLIVLWENSGIDVNHNLDINSSSSTVQNDPLTGTYAMLNKYTSANRAVLPPVERIGDCLFAYCSTLKSITLKSGTVTIGTGSFAGSSNLSTVEFEGTTLRTISDYAFSSDYGLGTVYIPKGTTTIGNNAFALWHDNSCTLYVPDSVTSFGSNWSLKVSNIYYY